jgi:MFS transporter, SHS family, lactate transporter
MASEKVDREHPVVGDSPEQEEKMSIGRYAATRFSTLKPPMDPVPNPFALLALLNTQQWLFFLCGFIAW